MTAIASFLTVMVLSLVITRIATVALTLTGMSRETARFQARSALTGTGFTTAEAESVVGHPVRRRIVMALMLLRNAGLVTAISSFLLSFTGAESTAESVRRGATIMAGLGVLWLASRSRFVDHWLSVAIRWALDRWTELEARDYARILDLSGDYSIRELAVREQDWLVGKTLGDTELAEEGVLVLGVRRDDGTYIGAPSGETEFQNGDLLILYGARQSIGELDRRVKGPAGDEAHDRAVGEQEARQRRERAADEQRSSRREKRDKDLRPGAED